MREFTSEETDAADFNPVEGLDFGLDGKTFACKGWVSLLEISELGRGAADDVDADSPEGVAYIANFMRLVLGAEYPRYRRHCLTHKTPSSVQVKILAYLNDEIEQRIEAETGRPTTGPSGSSAGPQDPAARVSKVISLQRGEVRVIGEVRKRPGHRAQGAPRSAPRRAGASEARASAG